MPPSQDLATNRPQGTVGGYEIAPGHFGLDCVTAARPTIDRGKMTATGVFVTDARDRVGDVIELSGIDLSNHRRLPIVLWDHGRSFPLPIGRCEDDDGNYLVTIDPENGVGYATTHFSQRLQEAEQIFALIDEQIIRAQSIGYREKAVAPIVEGGKQTGKHLVQIDMTEDTWCAVPVNAECDDGRAELIRKALSRGQLCGKSISPSIVASLSPWAQRPTIWAPGWTPSWTPAGKAMSAVDATAGGVLVGDRRAHGKDWNEDKHPRDKGRFASSAGSSATADKPADPPAELPKADDAAAAGASEGASSERDEKRTAFAKLAGLASAAVAAGVHAEHVITKFAYLGPAAPVARGVWGLMTATYTGAQAAVRAVAREKGLSDQQVNRVAGICCAVDLVCAKSVPLGLEHAEFGQGAAIGAGFVPVGSVAYLAWSAARNPKATYRAASKGVQAAISKVRSRGGKSAETDPAIDPKMRDVILAVADRVKAFGEDSDFWFAAFMAGLDQTRGDVRSAIAAADQVTKELVRAGSGQQGLSLSPETKSWLGRAEAACKSADWDESQHPRGAGGKFGNGTMSTNPAGMRVRRDAQGAVTKVHDSPTGTQHAEEEHFDTEKRPGFLTNQSDGRMASIQVPASEKSKHDLEIKPGLVFRGSGDSDTGYQVYKQYREYHEQLVEQLSSHVLDTIDEMRAGDVDPVEAADKINSVCEEFAAHLEHSKSEMTNWAQTALAFEHGDRSASKADEVKAAVADAFAGDDDSKGLLAAADQARELFGDFVSMAESGHSVDEMLESYEPDIDALVDTLGDAVDRTSEAVDKAQESIGEGLAAEADEERSSFEGEAEGLAGDLDEVEDEQDAAELARDFNQRSRAAGYTFHVYRDDDGEWQSIDDEDEEFEPDDVGVELDEPDEPDANSKPNAKSLALV